MLFKEFRLFKCIYIPEELTIDKKSVIKIKDILNANDGVRIKYSEEESDMSILECALEFFASKKIPIDGFCDSDYGNGSAFYVFSSDKETSIKG